MLRELIEKQGWPIAEVARRTGVSAPTVYRWIEDETLPTYPNARKLATILQAPELLEYWGYNGGATELRAETTHDPEVANGWRLDTLIAEVRETNRLLAQLVAQPPEDNWYTRMKEQDADVQ